VYTVEENKSEIKDITRRTGYLCWIY